MTIALPSIASRAPATTTIVVEEKRWRATSIVRATSRMPTTAMAMRQPNALSVPNTAMPAAMIHLPSGGWAMNDAVVV